MTCDFLLGGPSGPGPAASRIPAGLPARGRQVLLAGAAGIRWHRPLEGRRNRRVRSRTAAVDSGWQRQAESSELADGPSHSQNHRQADACRCHPDRGRPNPPPRADRTRLGGERTNCLTGGRSGYIINYYGGRCSRRRVLYGGASLHEPNRIDAARRGQAGPTDPTTSTRRVVVVYPCRIRAVRLPMVRGSRDLANRIRVLFVGGVGDGTQSRIIESSSDGRPLWRGWGGPDRLLPIK